MVPVNNKADVKYYLENCLKGREGQSFELGFYETTLHVAHIRNRNHKPVYTLELGEMKAEYADFGEMLSVAENIYDIFEKVALNIRYDLHD